jgi:hypothetical protein
LYLNGIISHAYNGQTPNQCVALGRKPLRTASPLQTLDLYEGDRVLRVTRVPQGVPHFLGE